MKRVNRSIRRAQAISPFGPGAILDLGQESFVILDTSRNRTAWDRPAQRITLPRLLPKRAPGGFRLPPTTDGFNRRDVPALLVQRFPAWLFCPRCRRMYHITPEAEDMLGGKKPSCGQCEGSVLVPMRYVAVCRNGHLSDVDWWKWAHSEKKGAQGQCSPINPVLYFKADSNTGSMNKSLSIECGKCKAGRTLKDITTGSLLGLCGQKCSGRQPWQRKGDAEACTEEPKALLRSQTAVYFPEVVSALDLQDGDSVPGEDIDAWIEREISHLLGYLDSLPEELIEKLAKKASSDFDVEVSNARVQAVLEAAARPQSMAGALQVADPLVGEWQKLTVPTPDGFRKAPLRVKRSDWNPSEDTSALSKVIDSVMLIERLREVRALVGFRRLEPDARLVPPDLVEKQTWLPALEVFGEGIFIRFSDAALSEWEAAYITALEARTRILKARLAIEDSWLVQRFRLKPHLLARFVMAHTFSHLLMRQLTYECGYSGASLRERIYVLDEGCGVLVYTADGDSEGSLGGLVRQGRKDRIVDTFMAALARSTWCSNDPICSEMPPHGPERLNQAACHACCLVPETSCTHLNVLLDRKLVVGDGTHGPRGFFYSAISG